MPSGPPPWSDPNFIDVTQALDAMAVPYYLCGGTLLRVHRDASLSPTGGDIDIWFPQNSITIQQALRLLETLGFRTEFGSACSGSRNLHGYREGGRMIDFSFPLKATRTTTNAVSRPHEVLLWERHSHPLLLSMIRLKVVLDGRSEPKSRLKSMAAHALYASRGLLKPFNSAALRALELRTDLKRVEYRIPSAFVEELERVSMGGVYWYQPRYVEPVLESLFGEDWQIPGTERTWRGFTKDSP